MTVPERTPSQTVGPYFEIAVPRPGRIAPFGESAAGRRVRIEGVVRDGVGTPVPDALLETWQADDAGHYGLPDAAGLARIPVGDAGEFAIETIIPGPVRSPDGAVQAPHLVVGVFARGLLARLVTRIYFPDAGDPSRDPILALVPAERRSTLIATPAGPGRYRFDLVLQGPGETVFFDV